MKKQVCTVLFAMCSLMVLNSVTTDYLGLEGFDFKNTVTRAPATFMPQSIVEAVLKKKPDSKEKKEVKAEEKKILESADASICQEKNREADLESKINKLIEDKEAAVKELAELKESTKMKERKAELNLITPEAPATNHDIIVMMAQLSSLLRSQQDQQTMLFNQMYSMFNNQSINGSSNYLFTPFSMNESGLDFQTRQNMYPGMSSNGIGIGHGLVQPYLFQNSAAMSPFSFQQGVQAGVFPQQPAFQGLYLDNGFNFSNGVSINSMGPIENNSYVSPSFFRTQI